jgi:hypothetical protein
MRLVASHTFYVCGLRGGGGHYDTGQRALRGVADDFSGRRRTAHRLQQSSTPIPGRRVSVPGGSRSLELIWTHQRVTPGCCKDVGPARRHRADQNPNWILPGTGGHCAGRDRPSKIHITRRLARRSDRCRLKRPCRTKFSQQVILRCRCHEACADFVMLSATLA